MPDAVKMTPEVERIYALPRRSSEPEAWEDLAGQLTSLLTLPNSPCPGAYLPPVNGLCSVPTCRAPMRLRALQGLALHDGGIHEGAFCPIDVGGGKTLITLLMAYVLSARRPLLLLPASLIQKTERERRILAQHWVIPNHIKFFSYEMLGRAQAAMELETYKPDLIICDEVHKLKNRRAAVTRRVARWMHEHPETQFVALSGTVMGKSLLDFGHILRWCLKDEAPIPKTEHELEDWAAALDEITHGGDLARLEPGALYSFCNDEEIKQIAHKTEIPIAVARRGFRRRLLETPGVVASLGDGNRIACSIYVRAIQYKMQPITDQHFAKLRGTWETPDGWPLSQGVDIWRHARELALGFHYVWDPRPPETWMKARRAWAAFVREVLSRSRTLDSELQVAQACDAGRLDKTALEEWRAVRDAFTPNTVAVWHDDSVLHLCAEWMKKGGVVWTEHSLFAEKLAKETGITYYGAAGLSSTGRYIEDSDEPAIIASIDANREGKNLQTKWSRGLIVSPPEGWGVWQQVIGRFHRPGQTADQVEIDVLLGCAEHANAWKKALSGTYAIRDTMGADPKLLLADLDFPTEDEIEKFRGPRWTNISVQHISVLRDSAAPPT